MKKLSAKTWISFFMLTLLVACGNDDSRKQFEITGTITNGTAKTIYLEEQPPGGTQGIIVDSSSIAKDGSYKLKAGAKESAIYNLRLDKSQFPVAAVINDVPGMKLNISLKTGSNEFTDKYEIQGSPASQEMKDFMYAFNNNLQEIYPLAVKSDSLHKLGAPDSVYTQIRQEWSRLADKLRNFSLSSLAKAKNAALYIFELGYYQETAKQTGFGLQPLETDEEIKMLNDAIARFPGHPGLLEIKNLKEAELARFQEMNKSQWVGKPAVDFSLPDANGKEVSLSSFKGKYVLVDFWASWCMPCRAENPNVVNAYNKFKDKNFSILGVSLDNPGEKDKWLDAVKKDNLTWTQVSDLKGWESVVVPIYGFGQVGIPYNILVDPQGTIIAERLHGPALEKKLSEVLK